MDFKMKTLQVGDRCKYSYYKGTVRAVHKEQIWFEIDGASECITTYQNMLKKLRPKAKRRRVWVNYNKNGWCAYDSKEAAASDAHDATERVEFIEVRGK